MSWSRPTTHQSKAGIEQLLADRFPRSEMLSLVQALPASEPPHQTQVGSGNELSAPGRMENSARTPTLAPIAPERYSNQVTIGLIERKREEAREAAARARAEEADPDRSVVPWLRQLGCRIDEARRAAGACERRTELARAPIEDRVRYALRCVAPRCVPRPSAG